MRNDYRGHITMMEGSRVGRKRWTLETVGIQTG